MNIKKNFIPKNFFSSGNLFFDKIVGGLSVGSSVLIYEDNFSKIYKSLIHYFLGEAVVKDQQILIFHCDNNLCSSIIESVPYKSTQVESLLNAKKINEINSEEMKIAWRYENIKYSNLLEDIVKSSDYIFDLSRPIQENLKKNIISLNIEEKANDLKSNSCMFIKKLIVLNEYLTKYAQEYLYISNSNDEESNIPVKYLRVICPGLFDNDDFTMSNQNLFELKQQLMVLKNIYRSLNAVVMITINPLNVNNKLDAIFKYYFDYVFSIRGFIMDDEKIGDYDGIFSIKKIPRLNALKMNGHNIEADNYGIIQEKRKMIIEQIDIGVEIDRNTKVKEKDVTKDKKVKIDNQIDF